MSRRQPMEANIIDVADPDRPLAVIPDVDPDGAVVCRRLDHVTNLAVDDRVIVAEVPHGQRGGRFVIVGRLVG